MDPLEDLKESLERLKVSIVDEFCDQLYTHRPIEVVPREVLAEVLEQDALGVVAAMGHLRPLPPTLARDVGALEGLNLFTLEWDFVLTISKPHTQEPIEVSLSHGYDAEVVSHYLHAQLVWTLWMLGEVEGWGQINSWHRWPIDDPLYGLFG